MKTNNHLDIYSFLNGIDSKNIDIDKDIILHASWEDFLKIESETKKILNDIIHKNKNQLDIKNIILINYKIFIEIANLIYTQILINKCRNNLNPEKHSDYFKHFLKYGYPKEPSLYPHSFSDTTFFKKIKKRLKLLLKTNTFSSIINFKNKNYVLFESDSKHTLEFLKQNKSQTYPLSLNTILKKYRNVKIDKSLEKSSLKVINIILNDYQNLALKYNLPINDKTSKYLHTFLKDIFFNSIHCYIIFKHYLNNTPPINVFIGSNNTMTLRAFSAAVKYNKGTVNTFTHGEPILYNWDKLGWMEFSLSDNYYEYTNKLAAVLKKDILLNSFNKKINIKSFNTKSFIDTNQYSLKKYKSNGTVMFIPNEYVRPGQLSQVSSFPNLIQLNFEIELMRFLAKKYKIVYYKKHPGGILKNENINFFPGNVKIITEPFEDVLNYTDNMIFGHSKTTTIGSALSLNKKVILFTGEWEIFEKEIYSKLKEQVYLINYIKNDNKLTFDKTHLSELLNAKVKNLNYYKHFLKTKQ